MSTETAATPHPDLVEVLRSFERLPGLLEADADLVRRGRFLGVDCLLGPTPAPFRVEIREGRIRRMERGPHLMTSWDFAYRADPAAFLAFWKPMPAPGCNDLLAFAKRGMAAIEGNLHPFIANLQYFKDLLALPRAEARS